MNNSGTLEPLLLGVQDAGKVLGISQFTVRAWIYQGRLPYLKLGSRVLVPFEELKKIVSEGVSKFTDKSTGLHGVGQ
jgi:excisionase family DNA binding protein